MRKSVGEGRDQVLLSDDVTALDNLFDGALLNRRRFLEPCKLEDANVLHKNLSLIHI